MNTPRLFALALLIACINPAIAEAPTARAHVEIGASAYLKDGANAAITAWLKGGPFEGNTQATAQANLLRQVEDILGKPEGFEVISENAISPKLTMILSVVYYQKGPLFGRFLIYKLASGSWVATEFRFDADAAKVFPSSALHGR